MFGNKYWSNTGIYFLRILGSRLRQAQYVVEYVWLHVNEILTQSSRIIRTAVWYWLLS